MNSVSNNITENHTIKLDHIDPGYSFNDTGKRYSFFYAGLPGSNPCPEGSYPVYTCAVGGHYRNCTCGNCTCTRG